MGLATRTVLRWWAAPPGAWLNADSDLPTLRLVVPHKLGGRKFFGSRAKSIPRVGQVVTALQSDPKSLGSGLVFGPVHEAA